MCARREEQTVQLSDLGWDSFFDAQLTNEERVSRTPARIVWEGRGAYRVSTGIDEWRGELSGRLRHEAVCRADLPTTGDWVVVSARPGQPGATIRRVLKRRTAFSRKSAGRSSEEQVVAANVDTVLLVTSLNRDFSLSRLERYLALVWESGANPVIVLSKADVCDDIETRRAEASAAAAGVEVIVTSGARGEGLGELAARVRSGGTTAFVGSSGVGKSTLINALLGEARQAVRPIREDDDRGRHSTTSRQLFVLPGGGVLLDTPGMRELQLLDADAGLDLAFSDIESLAARCQFRDCSHEIEPGCAVMSAAACGALDERRVERYRKLRREQAFLDARRDERARGDGSRRARQGSKALKNLYRLRGR
jgi:ribosome biogenesis GTPase